MYLSDLLTMSWCILSNKINSHVSSSLLSCRFDRFIFFQSFLFQGGPDIV